MRSITFFREEFVFCLILTFGFSGIHFCSSKAHVKSPEGQNTNIQSLSCSMCISEILSLFLLAWFFIFVLSFVQDIPQSGRVIDSGVNVYMYCIYCEYVYFYIYMHLYICAGMSIYISIYLLILFMHTVQYVCTYRHTIAGPDTHIHVQTTFESH